jgi:hypothetical protein
VGRHGRSALARQDATGSEGKGGTGSVRLITQRSQARILPLLPGETATGRSFWGLFRVSGLLFVSSGLVRGPRVQELPASGQWCCCGGASAGWYVARLIVRGCRTPRPWLGGPRGSRLTVRLRAELAEAIAGANRAVAEVGGLRAGRRTALVAGRRAVVRLEQTGAWFGRPLWDMELGDADVYFRRCRVARPRAPASPRAGARTTRTCATTLRGGVLRPLDDERENAMTTFAGVPGLEPRLTEPESAVLPITPYPTRRRFPGRADKSITKCALSPRRASPERNPYRPGAVSMATLPVAVHTVVSDWRRVSVAVVIRVRW